MIYFDYFILMFLYDFIYLLYFIILLFIILFGCGVHHASGTEKSPAQSFYLFIFENNYIYFMQPGLLDCTSIFYRINVIFSIYLLSLF